MNCQTYKRIVINNKDSEENCVLDYAYITEMEKQENHSLVEKSSDEPGNGNIRDSTEYIIDLGTDWDSDSQRVKQSIYQI